MSAIDEPDKLETHVLGFLTQLLNQRALELQAVLLRPGSPQLRRSTQQPSGYESELAVYFSDESGIFDVLEFHIYHRGLPSASREEFQEWMRDAIEDVLRRRRVHLEGGGSR